MKSGYSADTGIGVLYDESGTTAQVSISLPKMTFAEFNMLASFLDAQCEHAAWAARKQLSDNVRRQLEP